DAGQKRVAAEQQAAESAGERQPAAEIRKSVYDAQIVPFFEKTIEELEVAIIEFNQAHGGAAVFSTRRTQGCMAVEDSARGRSLVIGLKPWVIEVKSLGRETRESPNFISDITGDSPRLAFRSQVGEEEWRWYHAPPEVARAIL